MGDVARFVLANVGKPKYDDILKRIFVCLDIGLETNYPEVCELIVVSFVENFQGEEQTVKVLKPKVGPNLRLEFDKIY